MSTEKNKQNTEEGFYCPWDELLDVLKNAFPELLYDESPMELVWQLINERAEFKLGLKNMKHELAGFEYLNDVTTIKNINDMFGKYFPEKITG